MNEQMIYVLNIDTYILQNSYEKIADVFIEKHLNGLKNHYSDIPLENLINSICKSDIERFEAALQAIGVWQMDVDAITLHHEEDKVMMCFTSLTNEEASKLSELILEFSDVLAMKGADEVFAYFLGKDNLV